MNDRRSRLGLSAFVTNRGDPGADIDSVAACRNEAGEAERLEGAEEGKDVCRGGRRSRASR